MTNTRRRSVERTVGDPEAGGVRTSVVLLLALVLLAAGAAWWFLVPPAADPLPGLRNAVTEALTTAPFAGGGPEETSAGGDETADGAGYGLPGESGAGAGDATGPAEEESSPDPWRAVGAQPAGAGPVGLAVSGENPSADDGEPDPDDYVFTPMDAASRSLAKGAGQGRDFDPGLAPESMVLEFDGFRIQYEVFAVYVTPGHVADVTLAGPVPEGVDAAAGDLYAEAGTVNVTGPGSWTWQAPSEPGVYRLDVARQRSGDAIRLNAFVLTPYSAMGNDGDLGGYRIGAYPSEPLRGLDQYLPPPGFIQVTKENRDLLLSPHFTLGQFLCKQASDWPKYVTLREEMLGKLETILAAVNDQGVRADTFHVMSGFRTPFYNHAIGNVRYSRHQWGDASDIFVDVEPRDGVMDDINGDGKVSLADAKYMARLVEDLADTRGWKAYVGGLGIYGITATHGPFIHVDTRGFRARWSG